MFFCKKKNEKQYIKSINNDIFENSIYDALPQTKVYETVKDFLAKKSDKRKRVLIYGFDGARADSMAYLIPTLDENVTGHNFKARYSAVTQLKEEGGLYLSYAGGDNSEPQTIQETSTAQGWASILTGKWGVENGVQKHATLKSSCPTILTECAENGISAVFSSIWPDHFTVTYKAEIENAKSKNLPLSFKQVKDEEELQSVLMDEIDKNTGIIFGINEFPDYNGHMHGFGSDNYRYVAGITNADRFAFELFEHIRSREDYKNEDWLLIITSDHGGHKRRHGTQLIEDRMTFIAVNKKL